MLALTAGLNGCSSGAGRNGSTSDATPDETEKPGRSNIKEPRLPSSLPAAPQKAEDVDMPLEPYTTSSERQNQALAQAQQILAARCMRAKGFDYQVDSQARAKAGPQARLPGYGLNDPVQAASTGYSGVGGGMVTASALQDELKDQVPSIDDLVARKGPAYIEALYGFGAPNTGAGRAPGCMGANDKLYDDAYGSADRELPGRLAAEAGERTMADARVVKKVEAWSACMAAAGFGYATPVDAMRGPPWGRTVTPEQIATAVADVGCKQKTGLPEVWLAVERGYQQALVDMNGPALAEIERAFAALTRSAEAVILAGA